METNEGIRRIGRMVGMDSIDRNLVTEDEYYAKSLLGKNGRKTPDDMRILAARDVYINPDQPRANPSSTSEKVKESTTVTTEKPSSASSLLLPAALVAAVIAAGAGGYVVNDLLKPDRPDTVDTDTDTDTDTYSEIDLPD